MYLYLCDDMVRGSACKIKIHNSPRQKRRLFQCADVSVWQLGVWVRFHSLQDNSLATLDRWQVDDMHTGWRFQW